RRRESCARAWRGHSTMGLGWRQSWWHVAWEDEFSSRAEVQHHLATRAAQAMLPNKDALPCAQHQCAVADGNGERSCRQRGLDVPRHVVGAFSVVGIERI